MGAMPVKYLFFTAEERGKGDIYWVDAKLFEARFWTSS